MKIDYLFDRSEGFIKRWHAWPTIRTETLAEHNFFVTRNSLYIARLLCNSDNFVPDIQHVLLLAICHDETEKVTGDISGLIKRQYPELKELLNGIEHDIIQNQLYCQMPEELANDYKLYAERSLELDDIEIQIVKYSDVLDAYIFLSTEVAIGNSLMKPYLDNCKEFLYVMKWPWLQKLREEIQLP